MDLNKQTISYKPTSIMSLNNQLMVDNIFTAGNQMQGNIALIAAIS